MSTASVSLARATASRRLSAADLRRVLDTVFRVHACRTVSAFSHDGVQALLELIPADVLAVQLMRLNGEPLVMILSPDFPYTREQVEFYRRHSAEHPMVRHYAIHGPGRARRMSDVISWEEFERHPIYLRCLAPHGIRHTLGILLGAAAPGRRTGLSFDRRDADFTPREVALLEAVAPHVAQVLEHLELHTGRKRPWREPSTRDWLAGELGVTNREAEALFLVAEGLDNAAIAAALGITVTTLKKHLQNAYAKIGVKRRHAAARLVATKLGRA